MDLATDEKRINEWQTQKENRWMASKSSQRRNGFISVTVVGLKWLSAIAK